MHYGLAHLESSFHAKSLHKVVHLAPCFVPHVPNWTKSYANKTIMQFQSVGIYSINGPTWDEDLKTLCANFPGKMCSYYTNLTGAQGQSVTSEQYWVMNGLTDRFQEFADHWLDGVTETPLVEMSNIKQVPMSFFVGTKDEVCMHKTAMKYIPQIQSATNYIDVEGKTHGYFASEANDAWFMENLIAQLVVPTAAAQEAILQ